MRLSPRCVAPLGVMIGWGLLGLVLLSAPVGSFAADEAPSRDWSSFRNNFQMTGIAGTTLPEKLEVLWKIPAPFGVSATAAIVDDRVYLGTINGDFLCLDRKTGKEIWKYRSIDDPDPEAFAPAFKCSPTVTKDAIFVGDEDGVFHAIHPQTGKRKWKFHTNGEIISSPSLSGDKVIFGSYDNSLYCLNATDGKKIWSFETEGYVHCSPAIAGKFTFVTGCDEQFRVINIESGKEEANLPLATYLIASPALKGDFLYFGTYTSEVLSLNWKTREINWRYRDEQKEFPYQSSAAVTDDYVVVGCRDKQVHCIDRKTGKGVWKFATTGRKNGGRVDSSPVIAGDRVFVGASDGYIYEIGLKDGKERWKFQIGRDVTASPAVGQGCLVIGGEGQNEFIYCFGQKEK